MTYLKQPVLIGEVLFDVFENGQAILGGAPFNVAWHLQGFGQSPVFISRIGSDSYGQQIIETMQAWGMDTAGLQSDPDNPTGMVDIKLYNGQPTFDICNEVAYDYIDLGQVDEVLSGVSWSILYHGSLAARHAKVFDTILQMRQACEQSFVDINLRPPWWEKQTLVKLMQGANWLKVNDDELITLTGADNNMATLIEAARDMLTQYDIETIILTRGAEGADIIDQDNVLQAEPITVSDIRDTVGAGDAFSSICILGSLLGWNGGTILNRATEFAARICQQDGATQVDHALYDFYRNKWQLSE